MADTKFTVRMEVSGDGKVLQVFDQLGQKVGEAGAAAEKAGGQVKGASDGFTIFGQKVSLVINPIEAFTKAAELAHAGVQKLFSGFTQANAIFELAQKTGVAAEGLSRFQVLAAASGTSIEALGGTFRKLSQSIVEANDPTSKQAALLQTLGITAKDPLQAFQQLAAVFPKITDAATQNAVAVQLLGRSGLELGAVLRKGSEETQRLLTLNDKLGLTLDGNVKAINDTVDNWEILGKATQGVAQQLALGAAPGFKAVTDEVVRLVAQIGIGDGTLKEFGQTLGVGIAHAAGAALVGIGEFLNRVADVGLGKVLSEEFQRAFDAVTTLAGAAGKKIAAELIDGFTGGLSGPNWSAVPGLGLIIDSITGGFKNKAADLRKQADETSQGIFAAFDKPSEQTATNIRKIASAADTSGKALMGLKNAAGETLTIAGDATGPLDAWNKHLRDVLVNGGKAADAIAKLNDEVAKSQAVAKVYTDAAKGLGDWNDANERAKAVAKATADGITVEAAAIAVHKIAIAEAQVELGKMIVSERDAAGAAQASSKAFSDTLAATGNIALATEAATRAGEDYTRMQLEKKAADEGETAEMEKQAAATRKAADELRAKQAIAGADKEIADLQRQNELQALVNQGIISSTEAARIFNQEQIAIKLESEGVPKNIAEWKASIIAGTQALHDFHGEVINTGNDIATLLTDNLFNGFENFTSDLENMGKRWGEALFKNMLTEKLGFDKIFQGNILQLGTFAENVLGNLFSGGGGGIGAGGSLLNLIFGGGSEGSVLGLLGGGGGGGGGVLGLVGNLLGYGGGAGTAARGLGFGGGLFGRGGGIIETDLGTGQSTLLQNYNGAGGINPGLLWGGLGGFLGSSFLAPAAEDAFGIRTRGPTAGYIGMGGSILGGIGGTAAGAAAYGALLPALTALEAGLSATVVGAVVAAVIALLGALLGSAFNPTTTQGTLLRRAGEGVLDKTPTFKSLQESYGDLTRTSYRGGTPEAAAAEAKLPEGASTQITGFAGVFAQLAFGKDKREDAVRKEAQDWSNILIEFFSRMDDSSKEAGAQIRANLRSAFKDLGIDAPKALEALNKAQTSFFTQKIDLGDISARDTAMKDYGKTVRGVAEVFQGDYPAGVHVAELALESMSQNGKPIFDELGKAAGQSAADTHDALLTLSQDASKYDEIVGKLAAGGATFDPEAFKNKLADVTASVKAIAPELGNVFNAPSITAGLDAMAAKIKSTLIGSFQQSVTTQLLDKTNIGRAFEGAFALLRQSDQFDLSSAAGVAEFGRQMTEAIAQGRAELERYKPQLEAIQKAMEDAFQPHTVEEFFQALNDQTEAYAASLKNAVGTALGAGISAASAGGAVAGVAAFGASIKSQVQGAIQQAVVTAFQNAAIVNTALAPLLTKFSFMVAAAFSDSKVTDAEKAQLAAIVAEISKATGTLISSLTPMLEDVFGVLDTGMATVEERVKAIQAGLRDMVGTATGSFAEAIEKGGPEGKGASKEEATKAFADSLYEQVRTALVNAIVAAFTSSALIEGALAPLIDTFKTHFAEAMKDGVLDSSEKAQLQADLGAVGGGLADALELLKPFLGDLYDVIKQAIGVTTPPKEKATVTTEHGDIVKTKTPEGVTGQAAEYFKSLTDEGKDLFRGMLDDWHLSGKQAAAYIQAWGADMKAHGFDVDQALKFIATGAHNAGITIEEGWKLYNRGLDAISKTNVTSWKQLNEDQQQWALKNFGPDAPLNRAQWEATDHVWKLAYVSGIGMKDATDQIRYIMMAHGISFAEAEKIWEEAVLGGAIVAKDTHKDAKETSAAQQKAAQDSINFIKNANADAGDSIQRFVDQELKNGKSLEDVNKEVQFIAASHPGQQMKGAFDDATDQVSKGADKLENSYSRIADDGDTAAGTLHAVAVNAYDAAFALSKLARSVPESSGGHWQGGSIPAGQIGMVGERGPELFIARADGGFDIIPMGQLPGYAVGRYTGGLRPYDPLGDATERQRNKDIAEARNAATGVDDGGDTAKAKSQTASDIAKAITDAIKAAGKPFGEAFAESLRTSVYDRLTKAVSDGFADIPAVKAIEASIDGLIKQAQNLITQGGTPAHRERDPETHRFVNVPATTLSPAEIAAKLGPEGTIGKGLADAIKKAREEAEKMRPVFEAIAKAMGATINVSVSSAFTALAHGQSIKDFEKSLNDAAFDAVVQGIIDAMLASGPIKAAIDAFNDQVKAAVDEAMKDGVISGAEAAHIGDVAANAIAPVSAAMEALGPVFDIIGHRLGHGAADGVKAAESTITSGIESALKQAASQGHYTWATFGHDIKKVFADAITGGIIDGMVQGILKGTLLGKWMDQLAKLWAKEIDAIIAGDQARADAIQKRIDRKIDNINHWLDDPKIQAIFDQGMKEVERINKEFGITTDNITESANAAAAAADSITQANQQINTALYVKQLGLGDLDLLGRHGSISTEQHLPYPGKVPPGYVPAFATGGIVTGPTFARLGEVPEVIVPIASLIAAAGRDGGSTREGAADMLAEMRALRAEVAALRQDRNAADNAQTTQVQTSVQIDGREIANALTHHSRLVGKGRGRLFSPGVVG